MQKIKFINDLEMIEEVFREVDVFSKGEKIAVKLHMGETDNPNYIKPAIIKRIVGVLKEKGIKPFLYDSVVIYKGGRDSVEKYYKTAEKHGFTEDEIGCPVVISNNPVDVKTKDITVHVCKEIAEADGMLVVSHVKGHPCAGFGGAIKNLGMGGVTTESKTEIHKSKQACFDDLLAQGAQAVLIKTKKAYYINFLIDIAKNCDCFNNNVPLVADDIGVLFGEDICAIDTASLDLVNKQKQDVFKKIHNHDPYLQIDYACKLGIGKKEYELECL